MEEGDIKMKYDFELDMNNTNTNSIIINQIDSNTRVLEFGPATGRMTKYLKEYLNCEVYIVEIDKEGFNKSINFAVDGINDDISNLNWYTKFRSIGFDYIIFADVLEHLINPEQILKKSKELLKEDGKIIISLPNVAHDAVMIDLVKNKFRYRQLGILDNTHLRFFTRDSINELFEKVDLAIIREEAIYKEPSETEFGNSYNDISNILKRELMSRKYHNVYQFIFTILKGDYYRRHIDVIDKLNNIKEDISSYILKISYEDSEGFKISSYLQRVINIGDNTLELKFECNRKIKNIIVEFPTPKCLCKIYETYINGDYIDPSSINNNASTYVDNYFCFNSNVNGQVQFSFFEHINEFSIKFYYEDLCDYENLLQQYTLLLNKIKLQYIESNSKEINLNKIIENIKLEARESAQYNEERSKQIDKHKKSLLECEKNIETLELQVKHQTEQAQVMEKKLTKQLTEADEVNKNYSKVIKEQEDIIELLNKKLEEEVEKNLKLVKNIEEIQHKWYFKIFGSK